MGCCVMYQCRKVASQRSSGGQERRSFAEVTPQDGVGEEHRREAEEEAAEAHRVHVHVAVAGEVDDARRAAARTRPTASPTRKKGTDTRPGPTEKIDRRRPVTVGTLMSTRSIQP